MLLSHLRDSTNIITYCSLEPKNSKPNIGLTQGK
jgi:hypothetical protein